MRKWAPTSWRSGAPSTDIGATVGSMVEYLGDDDFGARLLERLSPTLPAASWSVYQLGASCARRLYLSASRGIPDTTRECWNAYLSGPVRNDRSLGFDDDHGPRGQQLCHITAREVEDEHRARVYEAYGMAERVSVVQYGEDDALFAVNFYRHAHQAALTDAQIADFAQIAPALLAMARKHVVLRGPATVLDSVEHFRQRLRRLNGDLTARELDVCTRLLRGMSQDGIAADLALSLPTVKTYRNRAFTRLGIHFRNELFALMLAPGKPSDAAPRLP